MCQSCGRSGPYRLGQASRPKWCRCPPDKSGPLQAPPGHVTALTFETRAASTFRERCRLASNAEREARDALCSRWVRCGRGWRELPATSKKVRALEAAYEAKLAELEALRAVCPHNDRMHFDQERCGTCYEHVESDVAQHRHLVREGFFDS